MVAEKDKVRWYRALALPAIAVGLQSLWLLPTLDRRVVAVLDRWLAGRTVGSVLGFGGDIPVVGSIEEGLALGPDAVLIGIAPIGGRLPDEWRAWLARALDRMERAGRLREDRSRVAVAAAGRLGLTTGGYQAMIKAMISAEQRQLSEGTSLIYNLARMEALSGDGQRAVRSLRRSIEADEELAMGINIDPAFAGIRTTTEFQRFAVDLGIAA